MSRARQGSRFRLHPLLTLTATEKEASMTSALKIRFVIGATTVAATLDDSGTTKDFASLLPLELELKDLFAREKSGTLKLLLMMVCCLALVGVRPAKAQIRGQYESGLNA